MSLADNLARKCCAIQCFVWVVGEVGLGAIVEGSRTSQGRLFEGTLDKCVLPKRITLSQGDRWLAVWTWCSLAYGLIKKADSGEYRNLPANSSFQSWRGGSGSGVVARSDPDFEPRLHFADAAGDGEAFAAGEDHHVAAVVLTDFADEREVHNGGAADAEELSFGQTVFEFG